MVIAYHLILTGYGHWLPNDPRGSRSTEFRAGQLMPLGPLHGGRKNVQPHKSELKSFYREARSKLEHATIWFDSAKRQVIAEAFSAAITSNRYTCFACAILSNHAHLVIRKHREQAEEMISTFEKESAKWLRRLADVPQNHPVWSSDCFKKFLNTADDVERTSRYVRDNPAQEGLDPQEFPWVKRYRDEWQRKQ